MDVAIVGGGPAGLAAAEVAADAGLRVEVFERMPTPGRKLLMAGRGGLNLTHSEPLARFLGRYRPQQELIAGAVAAFPPGALAEWCAGLGQPTFTGSSGRVFPVALKASPLLRAWLARLAARGVPVHAGRRWAGREADGTLHFEHGPDVRPRATVLALGGASWPRLGSDGAWTALLDVAVSRLRPANCGFVVAWSPGFASRFAGAPLKRIALGFRGETVRGEAVVTRAGIEGGAVYALSGPLRDAIDAGGQAVLSLDLRPDLTSAALAARMSGTRGSLSTSNFLRRAAGLSPVAIGLMQEALHAHPAPALTAGLVKAVPLRVFGTAGLDRAISTAGGIRLDELDGGFMLRRHPGLFAAGEMLDWEAPTGGYLLQASIATGRAAGHGVVSWLRRRDCTPAM